MTELPEGISEWAALSGPAVVLDAVRLRAQRGYRTETGVLQAVLSAGQRREVAKLLGTPWDVSGRPVRLQDLAAALAEHRLTVRGLVEAVDGHSIDDRRVIRARMTARAERERLAARHLLVVAGLPESTVDTFLSDGSLPSAGSGELTELMAQVRTVWQVLPDAAGKPVRLAQLAATVFGDAHALDWHTALGRAVARLAASVHRLPRPLRGGKQWRQALAVAGVRCDGVSSRALVLNLPLRGDAPAVAFCGAVPGEPVWLPLRALAGRLSAPVGTEVFVCENPTVLEAAADEFGARCPAMVCTGGMPTVTVLDLLGALADSGCVIAVRADIDEAGLRIVEQVRSVAPSATLWRFDARVYAHYLDPPEAGTDDAGLTGLRSVYQHHGVPLHEERLLDDLLLDLRRAARS